MTYCISDIHGEYRKYQCLLEKISFCNCDTLYVLGDVVDRGPQPMEVLRDMMGRANVIPLLGNHEFMAMYCLKKLLTEITEKSIRLLEQETLSGLLNWLSQGGKTTLKGFHALSREERAQVLDYLGEFQLYAALKAGPREYVLIHGGLENFRPERALEDYSPEEMIWARPDYDRVYFPDRYLVTGHTPTRAIPGNPQPDRIYQANHHIAIDCGAPFGGRLSAICLETGDEFYSD